ncbi:MAG: hypothetical protein J2P19_05580 [Pseudonocardia sp.]|nr:hypothetical protein [Pseudonocardia sp.]
MCVLLALLLNQRNWGASAWVGAVLVFYLVAVKLTLCRVETVRHRPCRWKVRGYLRCCDYHLNLKQGPPSLVWIQGRLSGRT